MTSWLCSPYLVISLWSISSSPSICWIQTIWVPSKLPQPTVSSLWASKILSKSPIWCGTSSLSSDSWSESLTMFCLAPFSLSTVLSVGKCEPNDLGESSLRTLVLSVISGYRTSYLIFVLLQVMDLLGDFVPSGDSYWNSLYYSSSSSCLTSSSDLLLGGVYSFNENFLPLFLGRSVPIPPDYTSSFLSVDRSNGGASLSTCCFLKVLWYPFAFVVSRVCLSELNFKSGEDAWSTLFLLVWKFKAASDTFGENSFVNYERNSGDFLEIMAALGKVSSFVGMDTV